MTPERLSALQHKAKLKASAAEKKAIKKADVEKRKKREAKRMDERRLLRDLERNQKEVRRKRNEPLFKTKVIDAAQMISVRIDSKTVILVHPDTDIEQAKQTFLNKRKCIDPTTM